MSNKNETLTYQHGVEAALYCANCGGEPHTWEACARGLRGERDRLIDTTPVDLAALREAVERVDNEEQRRRTWPALWHLHTVARTLVDATPPDATVVPARRGHEEGALVAHMVVPNAHAALSERTRILEKMAGRPQEIEDMVHILRAARAEVKPQATYDVPFDTLTPECQDEWRREARAVLARMEKKNG